MTPRHTIRFDAEGYASCDEHKWTSTEPGEGTLGGLAEHADAKDPQPPRNDA